MLCEDEKFHLRIGEYSLIRDDLTELRQLALYLTLLKDERLVSELT